MSKIVILGYGFTGKYLAELFYQKGEQVYITSRFPERIPESANFTKIYFDLEKEESYKNLPDNADIIWTFPAQPAEKVEKFLQSNQDCRVRVVFGTTSSYLEKEGLISEASGVDENIERVIGEKMLQKTGAVLIRLSGIYGNQRSPFDWLNRGLIKNSSKMVNLIHLEDIGQAVLKIWEKQIKGEVFNLNGGAFLWKDLWQSGVEKGLVSVPCPPEISTEKRVIGQEKIRKVLGENYSFRQPI